MSATPPKQPEAPEVMAAKRATARTGLIVICVVLTLAIIGDVFVLMADARHHRGLGLALFSGIAAVLCLGYAPIFWRRKIAPYRQSQTPPTE